MKLALLLATLLVAPDDEMLRAAQAVVVATAGPSHVRRAPGGWLETVTTMQVEEGIKGPLHAGDTFEIVELGGVLDGVGFFAAGAPQYREGERSLILLARTDGGDWTTMNMGAGRFAFEGDLLVRHDVSGWEGDGSVHREAPRNAADFLDYVRGRRLRPAPGRPKSRPYASGNPSVGSYLLKAPGDLGILAIRWASFPAPVVFFSRGVQAGAANGGVTSIQRGVVAWTNDPASNVNLQYGGETAAPTGLALPDGINSILLGDPAGEVPGSYGGRIGGATLALATGWFSTKSAHSYGGERFYSIDEADLVVQDGIGGRALGGNAMDHIITHELGHCIGLRHSDEVSGDGGTLSAHAVMSSTLDLDNDSIGSTLQSWDREAVDAVYGATASCTPPTITGQPQSQPLGATAVALSVTITGTGPFQVQWFAGARGSTTHPLPGATGISVDVKPATTTRYWARVTNGCAPAADSDEATVAVNGCPAVLIGAASRDTTLVQGRGASLFVIGTGGGGLRYRWFQGPSGDESRPLSEGPFLNVTPLQTTDYWARVTNDCEAFIDSETIHVTVTPCMPPRFVYEPSDADVLEGETVTLFTAVDGTAPIALANNVVGPGSYRVHASNECGFADSRPVTVHAATSCVAPTIEEAPQSTAVAPGTEAMLQVHARGTSLVYQWYEGETLDFTRPLGNSPLFMTPLIDTPRRFWVRVSNGCGIANSAAVTVAPVIGKRRVLR
ncbi:MAG TPA: M57 family metalloprotease [Thermoanaerobaculia bacterium]|nr:M57 family metalloprotease [Thermoanaerobaculia bacterium]